MSLVKDFIDSVGGFVSWGARTNKEGRARIREVVLKLSSELRRGLSLIINYIEGARSIDNDGELASYLMDARQQLLHTCDEFHICRALYDLRDEFDQLFNPIRGSVSIGHLSEIEALLGSLQAGERSVIDGFDEIFNALENFAQDFRQAGQSSTHDQKLRSELMSMLDASLVELEHKKEMIKTTARTIVDSL